MSRRRSAAGGPASLPLLPRLGECQGAPPAAYLKTLLPRLPRPPANGSARGARPQPMAAPLPGILPGPASNSCGRLVTRPPPSVRGVPWRGWAALQGETPAALPRRRTGPQRPPVPPSWTPSTALRDPPVPPSGTHGTTGPLSPGTGCRGIPKTEPDVALGALLARAPCSGPWRRPGQRWGHFVRRCGKGEKKSLSVCGKRGGVIRVQPGEQGSVSSTKVRSGQERPYGERFKPLKFNLGVGTFPRLARAP